jgi:hypothetical protein
MLTESVNFTGFTLNRIAEFNPFSVLSAKKEQEEGLFMGRSDDQVSVDTGVYNAARIWKLYGTIACKGDNTPERPHRPARFIEVPETLQRLHWWRHQQERIIQRRG